MDQIDPKTNQFPRDTSKSRAFRVCENSIFGWNGLVSLSLEKAVKQPKSWLRNDHEGFLPSLRLVELEKISWELRVKTSELLGFCGR